MGVSKASKAQHSGAPQLTGNDSVDSVAREFWEIQEAFEAEASYVHVAGGVVAALGIFNEKRGESSQKRYRFLAGPALALRGAFTRQAPRHLGPRTLVQLTRLSSRLSASREEIKGILESLVREQATLKIEVEQWKGRLKEKDLLTVEGGAERAALAQTMITRLSERISQIAKDKEQVEKVLPEVDRWQYALSEYRASVGGTLGWQQYVGLEVLLGYAFDVITNPTEGDPKSGILGGAGLTLNLQGLTLSGGIMAHHAAMLGPYVTVATWIN